MNTSNQKTHGFTLIELLIVIAIIGILASIGFAEYEKGEPVDTYKTEQSQELESSPNF